jgi:hypothetical protein
MCSDTAQRTVIDMRILVTTATAFVLVAVACETPPTASSSSVAPSAGSSSTARIDTDRLFWGAYQMNAEPHYRLIFEGGTTRNVLTDLRLLDASGAVRASTPFVPSSSDPMRLCPGGKGPGVVTAGPSGFGPWRATLAVDAQLFKDVLDSSSSYRVEVQVGGSWRSIALTYVCAATQ